MIAESLNIREIFKFMSELKKSDCVSVSYALDQTGVSRGTLFTYMNYLHIQRHRFPLDRKAYILKVDFDRLSEFVQERKSN